MNNYTKFKQWLDTMTGVKEPLKTIYTEDNMKAAWFNGYSTRNKEMRKAILVEADKHNTFLSEQAVSRFYERKSN
jgi:NRPS condensation-like uncharacterized protein